MKFKLCKHFYMKYFSDLSCDMSCMLYTNAIENSLLRLIRLFCNVCLCGWHVALSLAPNDTCDDDLMCAIYSVDLCF